MVLSVVIIQSDHHIIIITNNMTHVHTRSHAEHVTHMWHDIVTCKHLCCMHPAHVVTTPSCCVTLVYHTCTCDATYVLQAEN